MARDCPETSASCVLAIQFVGFDATAGIGLENLPRNEEEDNRSWDENTAWNQNAEWEQSSNWDKGKSWEEEALRGGPPTECWDERRVRSRWLSALPILVTGAANS